MTTQRQDFAQLVRALLDACSLDLLPHENGMTTLVALLTNGRQIRRSMSPAMMQRVAQQLDILADEPDMDLDDTQRADARETADMMRRSAPRTWGRHDEQ